MTKTTSQLSPEKTDALLQLLEERFRKNHHRHPGSSWDNIIKKLQRQPAKLWSLQQMESTGGEPDVVDLGIKTGEYFFIDCAKETPKARRSLCYDKQALAERKEHKPKGSAVEMAVEMGIQILDEQQYRHLQSLDPVDLKTSSWIQTPTSIRKLGGALFCDRRYDQVFVYHNGAISYYAARGFRGVLAI